jgi:hypothetical protein
MFGRRNEFCRALLFAIALTASAPVITLAGNDGIVRVKSAYPIGETVDRLKKDIAGKGIKFFDEINQSKLAADAGIKLNPSVMLIFGNPPLGTRHHLEREGEALIAEAIADAYGFKSH